MNPETKTQSNPAPSQAGQRGSLSVTDCSASDLIDALDMMRDEFQRIIACPGCNAEIEDLANRAQLKLIQRVPVIVQRDRAEDEAMRLRVALREMLDASMACDYAGTEPDKRKASVRVIAARNEAREALGLSNAEITHADE